MRHCSVYSVPGLHTLVIAILVLSVSRVLLIKGQVGTCSGTGCGCRSTTGYQCCLAVHEEASGALVGNATISGEFTLMPGDEFSVDSEAADRFMIDNSGVIRTNTAIDRERDGDCFLVAVTLTMGMMSTGSALFAIDILDINDHEPQFMEQNYTFAVPETLPGETVDLTCPLHQNSLTAVDNDDGSNSRIKYRIVSGSDYFEVQEDSPCIQNIQELDFETSTSFTLVLEARDGGMPPLSSNVTITFDLQDVNNENAPRFTAPSEGNLSLSVPEDQEVGSRIYHFMAMAADSFYFNIHVPPNESPFPFELNSTTGEMTISSALNFEDDPQYDFVVQAVGGSPSMPQISSVTVMVMIEDVNEAAVVTLTSLLNGTVENQISTLPILDVRIEDPDSQDSNRNNSIRILAGSEYFEIRFVSRFALVRQIAEIDRETTGNSFNLVLELTEGNNPVLQRSINTTIEIRDVNDNAPRLNQTVFYILETTQRTEIMLRDVAFDPDSGSNGTVTLFELISVVNQVGVNLTDRFICVQIDSRKLLNGLLRVPPLDREEDGASLNITVKLTDDGVPRMAAEVSFLVKILDVNDNLPQFSSVTYAFRFAENLPVDSLVGDVFASDADNGENGTIIYTIVDEITDFSIDAHSGEIRNQIVFDRELRENYTILVNAHDNGSVIRNTATAPVTVVITISDVNDNPPVFVDTQNNLSVPSNAAVGTFVGRVEAIDRDIGSNAEVNYRLDSSVLFSIGESTGDIAVAGDLSTQEGVVNVSITAFNPGPVELEATLNVPIMITIPNDNVLVIAVASSVSILVLLLIVVVLALIIILRRKNRKGRISISSSGAPLNNKSRPKKSILKLPVLATNGTKDRRGVQFDPHVQETTYDHKQAVVDDSNVHRMETKTKFADESPLTARTHHNGTIPLEEVNGGIPNQFYPRQRSPLSIDEVDSRLEFSQSSAMEEAGHYNPYDGNSDEESTCASNMNTLIPRFPLDEHPTNLGSPMRYAPPPHLHPHPQHTSPSHDVRPLPPHSAQYPLQNSGTLSDDLTPLAPDPQHNHRSMSPSPPIPPQPLPYIGMPPGHHILHSNGRNYPLVMPDAYGRDTPEVQRFQTAYVPSFASDYDTSTYASSELDEVLDFNPDVEHGVYTLSAAEYDEDTQL